MKKLPGYHSSATISCPRVLFKYSPIEGTLSNNSLSAGLSFTDLSPANSDSRGIPRYLFRRMILPN